MREPSRKSLPLLAILVVVVGIAILLLSPRDPPPGPLPDPTISDLGSKPDWSSLRDYDEVLTRREFEDLLRDVYTLDDSWRDYLAIEEEAVTVETGSGPPVRIAFGSGRTPKRYWRPVSELPPAPPGEPLAGLHLAIDPGHIGGKFAQMEERWYRKGENSKEVAEGDMTLLTAQLLKPRLEALGAKVTLVRAKAEPVTDKTPDDFRKYADQKIRGAPKEERAKLAARLFYRTSEIRARAKLVNESIKPDSVLCLHFNAEDWGGDPGNPQFTTLNHYHLILHGAYMPGELAHEDERFEMLRKIFQGIHPEELALSTALSESLHQATGLPAYIYRLDAPAREMGPGLWARNLLANRLYQCPVLFLEPYVMNSEEVFQRVQAGDYEGEREVAGRFRKSLYREYADAVTDGLRRYYEQHRAKATP